MKSDRRISKTKKATHSAFLTLLNENDLGDITITDICRVADINRKTFYNHYAGIHQLMDEIENEIVKEFEQIINQHHIDKIVNEPKIFFDSLNSLIKDNYEDYFRLVSGRYSMGLVAKITQSLKDRTRTFMLKSGMFEIEHIDYVATYTISGLVSLYQTVFEQKKIDIDSVYFSDLLKSIVMGGIKGIMIV